MRAGAVAVFLCALLTAGAECWAQANTEFEIGFTTTRRSTKQVEAIDFEGWTNYPNDALMHVGVSYMGRALKWSSAMVQKGRFGGTIEFSPGALPMAVYEVEVNFIPDRQRAEEFTLYPAKRLAQPYMLGTAKQIEEYRKARLKELKKMADNLRSMYDPLRNTFEKYDKGAGFNARSWDDDTKEWSAKMNEMREQQEKHRTSYSIMLFPATEESMGAFGSFLGATPGVMRDYLQKMKGGQDPGHIGGGPLGVALDAACEREYRTLVEQISLQEKLGDVEVIRAWLVKVNNLHDQLVSVFENARNRSAKPEDEAWVKATGSLKTEMPVLQENLKQFEKSDFFREYPNRLENMKDLVTVLSELEGVCTSYLGGTGDRQAYDAADGKYRQLFVSIVTLMGLSSTLAVTPPPAVVAEVKLTSEMEARIKQDITSFSSAPDSDCTATAIRISRFGNVAIPFLLDGLKQSNRKIGLWCAKGLAMYADDRIVPALIKFYEANREKEVQLVVIESVGVIGHLYVDVSVPFLLKQMATTDPEVIRACIRAAGMTKSKTFIPAACDFLADRNEDIRDQATVLLLTLTGDNLYEMGYDPKGGTESSRKKFAAELKAYWKDELKNQSGD
jgi:hypothetical protein